MTDLVPPDKIEQIDEASERGKDALETMFGSIIDGSSSAKDAVRQLLAEIAKGAVAAKVIQIASRELQKPENQAKIREGLSKLSKNVRPR